MKSSSSIIAILASRALSNWIYFIRNHIGKSVYKSDVFPLEAWSPPPVETVPVLTTPIFTYSILRFGSITHVTEEKVASRNVNVIATDAGMTGGSGHSVMYMTDSVKKTSGFPA